MNNLSRLSASQLGEAYRAVDYLCGVKDALDADRDLPVFDPRHCGLAGVNGLAAEPGEFPRRGASVSCCPPGWPR